MRFALPYFLFLLLAACSNGPSPLQTPEKSAAEVKADARARDAFARDLPKPPER